MNIVIDPEFKALIPSLQPEEHRQLEENILADGCRDPLVVWNGVLIDGHNRHEICIRNGVNFDIVEMQFYSRDEAELWICKNQLGRRNLTDFQRVEIALKMKPIIETKARQREHQGRPREEEPSQNSDEVLPIRTDDSIAEMAGVSRDTVRKVEQIQRHARPEVIEAVRTGSISTHMASQVAELPEAYQREVAESPPDQIKEVAKEVIKRTHVANNSGNNEWYTPAKYIDLARAVMGSIDTDPATSLVANRTVRAEQIYTSEDDGRTKKWSGNVWMNPPYAQPLMSDFAETITNKYLLDEIDQACVLVNNATETQWFQRMMDAASAVCFPKSRIKFIDQDGNPGGAPLQGQAIIYMGGNAEGFVAAFCAEGTVLLNG